MVKQILLTADVTVDRYFEKHRGFTVEALQSQYEASLAPIENPT
jgi:hypothetical protein